MKRFLIFISFSLALCSCYKEEPKMNSIRDYEARYILSFNGNPGIYDENSNTLYFSISRDTIEDFNPEVSFEDGFYFSIFGKELVEGEINELGSVNCQEAYTLSYKIGAHETCCTLKFTTLALMQIICPQKIQDEPKVLSKIYLQFRVDSDHSRYKLESWGGVEERGSYSILLDKTSLGLELWSDKIRTDQSLSLLGMRRSADWVLDAMYTDKSHLRNKSAAELWKSLSLLEDEHANMKLYTGVEMQYLELFINNAYHGLYGLSERIDENFLKISSSQYPEEAVLYKAQQWENGSLRFSSLLEEPTNSFIWEGWEQWYPKNDASWNRLYELRNLVVNSDDQYFSEQITSQWNFKNLVDYYLFLNLLLASDNCNKNTYMLSYTNDSPFSVLAWDLDYTFGLCWPGNKVGWEGLITNGIYDRLYQTNANNFKNYLSERWAELRQDQFRETNILSIFQENYLQLCTSRAYEREYSHWQEEVPNIEDEYNYLRTWIRERIAFLDHYFESHKAFESTSYTAN